MEVRDFAETADNVPSRLKVPKVSSLSAPHIPWDAPLAHKHCSLALNLEANFEGYISYLYGYMSSALLI